MRYHMLRFILLPLLALSLAPADAQQKGKKRRTPAQHPAAHPRTQQAPKVDIGNKPEEQVPVPQGRTLKPELKKTRKVVIVPAPPPPPGPDPVPPYPKR